MATDCVGKWRSFFSAAVVVAGVVVVVFVVVVGEESKSLQSIWYFLFARPKKEMAKMSNESLPRANHQIIIAKKFHNKSCH